MMSSDTPSRIAQARCGVRLLVLVFDGVNASEWIWSIVISKAVPMQMHDPAHPGDVIREACLKPLALTVTSAAAALGVTRKALSDLLNGHSGVSPDMAIRLEQVFGSSAETWLRMQMQRDLWEARQRSDAIKVTKRYAAPMPA
jgi:addiction module HigA family antidote